MTPEQKFESVAEELAQHAGVTLGKMMSSPGIQFNGKNFAFFYQDQMVFRLGREWKPEENGIRDWKHLSPFKKKAPLYDWYCITAKDADLWPNLASKALSRMIAGK
ncbi:MAG: hypothetical protein H6601_10785 [Flavobacteriales bacterium]|nr:hypothetical protein [Flavobacteriales bacterium]